MAFITPAQAGSPNVPKFLDLLAWAEGTSTSALTKNDGYDVIVSGFDGPEIFSAYDVHPFWASEPRRPPKLIRKNPLLRSDAAGRYQLMAKYWPDYQKQLPLPDFSPLSQDIIAIQQIKERKALSAVVDGDIGKAIVLCSGTWASLPGNDYGQGGHTLVALMEKWNEISAVLVSQAQHPLM